MYIGIDTGGTFTDFVCWSNGQAFTLKVPSTPSNPADAVLDGLRQLLARAQLSGPDVRELIHGTTVATNAVLERKGAHTAIITTAGFKDVLEIGRQLRQQVYDLDLQAQTPAFLAPGRARHEVTERITATGEVLKPLDEAQVVSVLEKLKQDNIEAVAVCLLFAFLNPAHEQRIETLAKSHAPGLALSLSSSVDPAFREYERLVVTAFDAYTKPVLERYLQQIVDGLANIDIHVPLKIMQSRGGICAAQTARQHPVKLFLSGPAAGVLGGARVGTASGATNLITVDIGGTSCDVALVSGGTPTTRPEGQIDGFPVRVPMVDVNAIGAGGGSIAWLDKAGGLRVGPHSAGASPGPACYDAGGEAATVTDASLVLGYLNPLNFASGTLTLNTTRASEVIKACVATPLGLTTTQAALGIHAVVNAQMAEALRLVSIRQGYDPRDFALVALGGAGPVHAAALAEELDIDTVLVPPRPGVLSAEGLLFAPVEHECARGYPVALSALHDAGLRDAFETLDEQCQKLMDAEQLVDKSIHIEHHADVCYVGQSHYLDVEVDVTANPVSTQIEAAFLTAHERVFGYATQAPARLINIRSIARADSTLPPPTNIASSTHAEVTWRDVVFGLEQTTTAVVARATLPAGWQAKGPTIVEQDDTTTVVPPGWHARLQASGALKLERHTW
jgi:N-methylhydantoinase A/oxoprolinase/acetone carboxylase beta subunit